MADNESQTTTAFETSADDATQFAISLPGIEDTKSLQNDPELEEILNSALQDFDKNKEAAAQQKQPLETSLLAPNTVDGCVGAESATDPTSVNFTEELSDELAAQFEEAMKTFLSRDPHMMEQIEKLAEAAGSAADSPEAQQQFAATLSQTLAGLAQNAEGLQNPEGDEELSQAFSGMGAEGPGDDFMPMMQGLMQTLLSKDILYPSLKEISAKYPAYLEENKDKLEEKTMDTYRKQYDLMNSICVLFEEEKADEGEEVKNGRFEKLLDLMQQMQELGQPPKDIVGEMAPGLEFDENGMPKLNATGSQCNVM